MWCVPELNDKYIENMEDVLEIYERPYNPAEPVICLDEKPITLHAEVRPPMAAEFGREARRDSSEWTPDGLQEPGLGHFRSL
jgi:hypothetical protein